MLFVAFHVLLLIFTLCLIFISLINMFLGVFCLWFIYLRLSGFLGLVGYFPLHFREREIASYIYLMPFLFVFFFWDTYDSNVGAFNIVPEVSEVVLISFNSFFLFFSSLLNLFPPFYLPRHVSSLLLQLFYYWLPPECF